MRMNVATMTTALDVDDEQNGVLTLELARLEPVGDSPAPPESLAVDDIVVLIDAETLGLFQASVTQLQTDSGP